MATVDTAVLKNFLSSKLPRIDQDILNYVVDVTHSSADDFDSSEDLYDAVGVHLTEAADDEYVIKCICDGLMNLLKRSANDENDAKNVKILNAPIHIGDRAKEHDDQMTEQNSIWLKANEVDNLKTVDMKKIEKVDNKRKEKLGKRDKDENTKNLDSTLAGPTTNQVIQKKDMKVSQDGGKLVDIRIENIDLAYGSKVLLKNANLVMACGRRYGFVGRNGMGKTTLLRAISRRELYIPPHITVLHVEQEVIGDDTLAVDSVLEADTVRSGLLKKEADILLQMNTSKSTSLSDQLAQVYEKLKEIESDSAPARASMILCGLGFAAEKQKMTTKEFSGGWRMRIALARALFVKPDLLLLDEPTNMLDVKAILWLEDYLQTWPTTLYVVSHDRMFLDAVATDIIFLHSKDLDYYKGNYTQFEKTKDEKLKNQQREYEAQKQYRDHLQAFIDRWRVNANRAAQAQSKIKILEKLPDLKPVEMIPEVVLRLPSCDVVNATMLRMDAMGFQYSTNGPKIFDNVDLSTSFSSRVAVVGENGSGKTTLLKLLLGDLEPTSGVRHMHRACRVGYFSQHHVDSLDMNLSCVEMFREKFPGKQDQEYRSHLGRYGVSGELAMRPINSLSGGQKSRVAFAVMTWHSPNFFILDEPTNHLDIESVEALGNALNTFNGGVILVSHNEQLIQLIATETWHVGSGTVKRIEGGFTAYKKALQDEFARIGAF